MGTSVGGSWVTAFGALQSVADDTGMGEDAPFPPLLNTSSGIQSFMASAGGFRSNRKVPGGMFAAAIMRVMMIG